MLISQPGSDYQLTQITLDAGQARDITCLLLEIHAVLDRLRLDGTRPEITSTADAILREPGSPYTLPALISALDEVISHLTRATRHAIAEITPPVHEPVPSPLCRPCLSDSGPLRPGSHYIRPIITGF